MAMANQGPVKFKTTIRRMIPTHTHVILMQYPGNTVVILARVSGPCKPVESDGAMLWTRVKAISAVGTGLFDLRQRFTRASRILGHSTRI